MVFENLVSQVLNSCLGEFVENLDGKQLNIGIWGGNVELSNLVVKSSALDALEMPIQVVQGKIGKLILKIPWSKIYTAPWYVTIKDVYVLVKPNVQVKYDAKAEELKLVEAKRKAIERVEEAQRAASAVKPDATFVQKIIQTVIKNVQVQIQNVHLRYEDQATNPLLPFAMGVTLSSLVVESTDSNWKKAITQDVKKIFKIFQMDALSVYWNCKSQMYGQMATVDLMMRLRKEIATQEHKPDQYAYILGPITASCRLEMNQKPEECDTPYSCPVYKLNLDVGSLFMGISKSQYRDIIALAESTERMVKAMPYRKYRPDVPVKGHAKEWWHYVYTCVLEGEVRRQRRNWDWKHMLEYRRMCADYQCLYRKFLENNMSPTDKQLFENCEMELDLTNLMIIRQKVQMEAERIEEVIREEEKKQNVLYSWMSWSWGIIAKPMPNKADAYRPTDLLRQFEKEMTPDEKKRLYKAIDFQETPDSVVFPKEFIDKSFTLMLSNFQIVLMDDEETAGVSKTIMSTDLRGVNVQLKTRAAASALIVRVYIDDFSTVGVRDQKDDWLPVLIEAEGKDAMGGNHLLDVLYETNPLDGGCDQRLHVRALPIKITYDALTINTAVDVFKMPADTSLHQLSAAATSGVQNVKQMTATGLQYAIDNHDRYDIQVDLHAPYIVVPYEGRFRGKENVAVVNLGLVKISSEGRDTADVTTVQSMFEAGLSQEAILERMIIQSYDTFRLELSELQFLIAQSEEDWRSVINASVTSDMHLLNPLNLAVTYSTCIIRDDPRLPHHKVSVEIPAIDLVFSDARLLMLAALLHNIPMPAADDVSQDVAAAAAAAVVITSNDGDYCLLPSRKFRGSTNSVAVQPRVPDTGNGYGNVQHPPPTSSAPDTDGSNLTQFRLIEAKFVMSELRVSIHQQENFNVEPFELITFKVKNLEGSFDQRTYDLNCSVRLRSVDLIAHRNGTLVGIVETAAYAATADPTQQQLSDEHLLKIDYVQADPKSPDIHTLHDSCETSLLLDMSVVNLNLHQEALLTMMSYFIGLQTGYVKVANRPSDRSLHRSMSVSISESRISEKGKKDTLDIGLGVDKNRKALQPLGDKGADDVFVVETIKFKLVAKLQEANFSMEADSGKLATFSIRGISSDIIVKEPYTQVNAELLDMCIIDQNPSTNHCVIMKMTDSVAILIQVVMNNLEVESEKPEMEVMVKMGGARVVYLNRFVSDVLNFMNRFEVAREAIIEASQAAAQKAKENMKEVYQKAVKVSLNVRVRAPDIVVPVHSRSHDAILLCLGVIVVKNNFMMLEQKHHDGHTAVVDRMKITLAELKVSKVKMSKTTMDDGWIRERVLLEPLSCTIILNRNLSADWFKTIPELEMSGQIDTLRIQLSNGDYQSMMHILEGNMKEGSQSDHRVDSNGSAVSRSDSSYSINTPGDISKVVVVTAASPETPKSSMSQHVEPMMLMATSMAPSVAAVTDFFKFAFTLQHTILNLYIDENKDNDDLVQVDDNGMVVRPKNYLARLHLEGLSLKGRILSDDSIVFSMLLVNCLLDDMRAGLGNKLTRLVERTAQDDNDHTTVTVPANPIANRSMIDVTYQQDATNMFLDLRVYSFTVIVCVEYLLKFCDFFTIEKLIDVDESFQRNKATLTTPEEQFNVSFSSHTKQAHHHQQQQQQQHQKQHEPDEKQETQMTVNVKVEKSDIILVETMESFDTKAMFLNSEIIVKYRQIGQHQVINGIIRDMNMYTCQYRRERRAETRGNVLHPVSISLAGSTPNGQGLHLDLILGDVLLNVSPATIELLNTVMYRLTQEGPGKDELPVETFNYEKLWEPRRANTRDFWFLRTDSAIEATEDLFVLPTSIAKEPLQELCIISVPSIVVTVEAGVGNKTLPMLLLETTMKGSARNWSSQLNYDAVLTVQMSYYNSRLALWEPLVEPLCVDDRANIFVPWQIKIEMTMLTAAELQEDAASPIYETTVEKKAVSCNTTTNNINTTTVTDTQQVSSLYITSETTLELNVTKTCLEVLDNLGKAFASAISSDGITKVNVFNAYYKVLNDTGEDVTLLLEKGSFKVADGGSSEDINRSAAVPLQLKEDFIETGTTVQRLREQVGASSLKKDRTLHISVGPNSCELTLPVTRADKRFFMLRDLTTNANTSVATTDDSIIWGVISDVKVEDGITFVTLRSVVQVVNHFDVPIDVYYMTQRQTELELVGTVASNAVLNVPLKAVYTPTGALFFTAAGYDVSTTPYVWKTLRTSVTVSELLRCPKRGEDAHSFIIKITGETEQVYFENTSKHTMASTCFNIHLRPALVLKNFLPVNMVCCADGNDEEYVLPPGDTLQLPYVDPHRSLLVLRLPDYLEKEWCCTPNVSFEQSEFAVWTFESYDSMVKMSLHLGVHTSNVNGTFVMSLYCPFWMLNKTGLALAYRNHDDHLNVLHHPADFNGPIMFSFNEKNFFGKKKASIRVDGGEWSEKFSLDVAGSSGVISCKSNGRRYQVGVHNQLTYNNLTKQITFTPFYVVINEAPFAIQCQEFDRPADPWITVDSKSCSALWSRSEQSDKLLRLRVADTEQITAPFLYTESHTTLLKLENKFGGINVDIQLTEGAVYINLAPYQPGCAPALIVNHTAEDVNYWEKDSAHIRTLKSRQCVLYTWENPSGPRMLVWEKGDKTAEVENDMRKDAFGHCGRDHGPDMYWSSFLDGMQRVLLFTEDRPIAEATTNIFEVINQELCVSIHGVGLSLVNNETHQEVMYVGIASSGVIWETCKPNRRRWKQMRHQDSNKLETAYQRYLETRTTDASELVATSPTARILIDQKVEVDFELMQMMKPSKKLIRRTYETGLWLHTKTGPSQLQLHAKINRLQIDNQDYHCIFPVVLAPIAPPKSVSAIGGVKPFVEVSVVELLGKYSQIRQFKYFKVLVQEFHLKVDMGFMNAVMEMLQRAEESDEDKKRLFADDLKLAAEPLYLHASTHSMQQQKSFYDVLHFSPLKIHVSFSMAAGSGADQNTSTPNFLNVLLQGVGVTLTDLNDVVFKLAFFERNSAFLTRNQLYDEVSMHYFGQLVKQLYVLVLGLDVIGNPYGLVVGIGKGVEDLFYEPFQGAIQGPSEFVEGLGLGVKSLFGHTVGGTLGAVSKITGAMGKGIAALTFDDDFQKTRRDQIGKRPATVHEGIARSGKGLVMGVFDGVTGVFTKPVSGAKQQGVEGFFKGLGKGAVGLVTRPAAGVIDFASGSLDVVKRAAESSEDASRLRPARFLHADGLVRPYNRTEAEGHKLLFELSKGKYAKTDGYVYHYEVVKSKEVLLLTDKRVVYVVHNDLFGGWQVEWSYTWQELKHPAKVVTKGVCITAGDAKKKLFGTNENCKIVLVSDPKYQEEICARIEAMRST